MKKTVCLACALFLLLTLVTLPSALAMGIDYSGDWACLYVDMGDGMLLPEYEGQVLKDVMKMQLNADGTYTVTSFGQEQSGTWQPTGAGIALLADGIVVPFSYEDDLLVNSEEGVIMYFGRAETAPQQGGFNTLVNIGKKTDPPAVDYAGSWNCISYEASGVAYDINLFFPDGIVLTLNPDGTGKVQITPEYAEALTWSKTEDGLTIAGSYLLYNPVWDPEAKTLSLNYASDLVRVVFEKMEAGTVPAQATLPQVYTCAFFTAAFPESWEQDEYNTYNWDNYYSAQYNQKDDSGSYQSSFTMTVSIEEVGDYRSGISELMDYAHQAGRDTLDEVTVDGITFQGITYGEYWFYTEYFARVPEASATIHITVSSPEKIQDVLGDVLASIRFTYPIPDPPYVDPPLPEDGVPYQPTTTAVQVGGFDLRADWLPIAGSIVVNDAYNSSLAVIDHTAYILAGNKLSAFTMDGPSLTAAGEPVDLGNSFNLLSASMDGTLYITDGFYSAIAYKDGVAEPFELDGYLSMNPEGLWGLCYWSSYTVKKVSFTPDGMAVKDWVLKDLSDDVARKGRFSSVDYIRITGDHIFVAGMDATTSYVVRIAMYDFDGNELAVFGSENWSDASAIGSVSGIVQTNNGILVQDGFYQDYKLFAMDGTFIGRVGCDDLLGTASPTPISLVPTDNGALALLAQKRDDGSAIELLVFALTGF